MSKIGITGLSNTQKIDTPPSFAPISAFRFHKGVGQGHMRNYGLNFAKPLLSIVFVVAVWQFAHATGLTNRNLFPGPVDVALASIKLFFDGVMVLDLKTSVSRAAVGFSLGAVLGILSGILTARVNIIRLAVYPFFNILRPIPAIALVPIAIVWFGIGEESKYFVIAYTVFWPCGSRRITVWSMYPRRTFVRPDHWARHWARVL